MKLVTTQQMTELEQHAKKEYSITEKMLMENAGIGISKWINNFCNRKKLQRSILIVSGKGSNAGDSFVAARYLVESDFDIDLVLLSKETDLKGSAKANYLKLKKKRKVSIHKITSPKQFEKIKPIFENYKLVLDGILGTGIKGEVTGLFKQVIEFINSLSKIVVAIDIPSGMDANSGAKLSINACYTLTIGLPKIGIIKPQIEDATGIINVIDIGLPSDLVKTVKGSIEYLHSSDCKSKIPKRKVSYHKGDTGHVLILAGSPNFTGAAKLCVQGALRAGAGLVTLGVPRSLHSIYQNKFLEAMTLPLPDTENKTLSQEAYSVISDFVDKVDCIALGPGLSRNPDTIQLVRKIVSNSNKPLVIDADGINAIAEELLVLRKAKAPLILTPHVGEMANLLSTSAKGVQKDRWKIVRDLADKYGITVLLKGFHSVIAGSDKKIYINSTGNSGMASGGMGDVLTGMIASFIAQGLKPLNATLLGAFIHGAAGDAACYNNKMWSIIASDLIDKIPFVLEDVSNS